MKIGAIGIRTKIIVGDAATWYLVKKYIDGKLVGGIDDVPEELKKYVRVLGSWVDVTSELDKLAEYPELTGIPNKFVSDDGTVKEITSSIGVVGTDLYASVEPSTLLAGAYQLKQTIDPTETQMTIIAGGGAIVAGAKFIDENPAQAFPMGTVGFDYWRKISSLAGEARKGLRFFLFDTADNSETDIFAPLWSSPIEVTDFTERQISYSVPAVNPTATQHFGVEFLFTATGSDKTLTYIVGDGRGWFMRLPLPLKHENLTDKNSEAAFQHVDTTTVKETLAESDKVPIYDSDTGNVVLTPKSNFNDSGSKLLVDYTHNANKEVNVESIDFATSVITATNHGLTNGNLVVAANNFAIFVEFPYAIVPTGINLSTIYYVVNKTDNTFQLSLTSGGTAIGITDKATKDYTKWHFEILGAVDFTNLPNLKKARIILNGKSFTTETPASYFLFYKNNNPLLGGPNTVWSQSGGRYGNSSANLLLLDVLSRGQCYNYHDIFIDFSLYRATLIVNGSRLYAVNNTSNASVIKNNATYVHVTDGNIDFDKISINSGVPNGFNIKIYSV